MRTQREHYYRQCGLLNRQGDIVGIFQGHNSVDVFNATEPYTVKNGYNGKFYVMNCLSQEKKKESNWDRRGDIGQIGDIWAKT